MVPTTETNLVSTHNREATARIESVASVAAARLRNSPYAALRDVACESRGGLLTLRGRVSSYHLKQLAQALLEDIPDLLRLDNRLEVVAPPTHEERRYRDARVIAKKW